MTTQIKPVTIPRKVADAIEFFRDGGANDAYSNEQIAYAVLFPSSVGVEARALRSIPFDTLMRALLDGYERELTEEEKREAAYADIRFMFVDSMAEGSDVDLAYASGIEFTLGKLGIKITEVNA